MLASALADYDKAISLDNTNSDIYLNRGYTKQRLRDLNGSCKDFKQAAKTAKKK